MQCASEGMFARRVELLDTMWKTMIVVSYSWISGRDANMEPGSLGKNQMVSDAGNGSGR